MAEKNIAKWKRIVADLESKRELAKQRGDYVEICQVTADLGNAEQWLAAAIANDEGSK